VRRGAPPFGDQLPAADGAGPDRPGDAPRGHPGQQGDRAGPCRPACRRHPLRVAGRRGAARRQPQPDQERAGQLRRAVRHRRRGRRPGPADGGRVGELATGPRHSGGPRRGPLRAAGQRARIGAAVGRWTHRCRGAHQRRWRGARCGGHHDPCRPSPRDRHHLVAAARPRRPARGAGLCVDRFCPGRMGATTGHRPGRGHARDRRGRPERPGAAPAGATRTAPVGGKLQPHGQRRIGRDGSSAGVRGARQPPAPQPVDRVAPTRRGVGAQPGRPAGPGRAPTRPGGDRPTGARAGRPAYLGPGRADGEPATDRRRGGGRREPGRGMGTAGPPSVGHVASRHRWCPGLCPYRADRR